MTKLSPILDVSLPTETSSRRFDVIVIGAGQAGLATGYHLKKRGMNFVILDDRVRVGDVWRNRWDSLRLFTPSKYDGLPGLQFPLPGHVYPTGHQMADYLEGYAERMSLPVQSGIKVDGLWPANDRHDRFVVTAGDQRFEADQVVVATGMQDRPRKPEFASLLSPEIRQLHSSEYLRPSQLADGDVLVVGSGNSGAEIALETASNHKVILSGTDTGQVPVRINSRKARLGLPVLWFVANHVLTLGTPAGRKVGPFVRSGHGAPVVRVKRSDLAAAGVERIVAKIVGVQNGLPLLDGGQVIDASNVIWCTGFKSDFNWIHLPLVTSDGYPEQSRGVVPSVPGLYFVGLAFLYSFSSMLTGGVGRDAERIAQAIEARMKVRRKSG